MKWTGFWWSWKSPRWSATKPSKVASAVLLIGTHWAAMGFSESPPHMLLSFLILTCVYRSALILRTRIKAVSLSFSVPWWACYVLGWEYCFIVLCPVLASISEIHFVLNLEGQAELDYSQSFPAGKLNPLDVFLAFFISRLEMPAVSAVCSGGDQQMHVVREAEWLEASSLSSFQHDIRVFPLKKIFLIVL